MSYRLINKLVKYLKYYWIPIIIICLSIYDLRIDLSLLFDFFTWTTFLYTIKEHTLAITVLLIVPNLFNSLKND